MKDFLGRELVIGDEVIYLSHGSTSSKLYRAIIVGFTPMKVRMETYDVGGRQLWNELKFPYHIVKVGWSNERNS